MQQGVPPDDLAEARGKVLVDEEDARDQEHGPRDDRPHVLPHRHHRADEAVERAHAEPEKRGHGEGQDRRGHLHHQPQVVGRHDPAHDDAEHHRLRDDVEREARHDGVGEGHRRVGQKRLGVADRGCDLLRQPGVEREGQVSRGVEQREVVAERGRAQRQREHDRQQRDGAHGLQHRPDVAARRAAVGRGHLPQHQRGHRPRRLVAPRALRRRRAAGRGGRGAREPFGRQRRHVPARGVSCGSRAGAPRGPARVGGWIIAAGLCRNAVGVAIARRRSERSMDDARHDRRAGRAEPEEGGGRAGRAARRGAGEEVAGRGARDGAPGGPQVLTLSGRKAEARGRRSSDKAPPKPQTARDEPLDARRSDMREAPARPAPETPDPRPATEPAAQPVAEEPVGPPAGRARRRGRHNALIVGFVVLVLVPWALTTAYLYLRAADQYASTTGFAVRTEEMSSAFDILGGITQLGGSSSSDTDILYEFIQGQQLVADIDRALDLEAIYSRHWATDPVFSLRPGATIEDLVDHWRRKVRISYDPGTGLIELRVLAFERGEAQAIATAIFDASAEMINALSAIAREDATRYARQELAEAVERLKGAREAMSAFRSRTQIVDPQADLSGQMGLINNLQSQLAASLIELDLVRETAREGDPRISQSERRIDVIERRIAEERGKFSIGGAEAEGEDYVAILAEFDRLDVDLQFARSAYTAALAAFDEAQSEAQRKSRYLAAYVAPTLSESAEYPRRAVLSALAGLFLVLTWAILSLIFYSIRDRR